MQRVSLQWMKMKLLDLIEQKIVNELRTFDQKIIHEVNVVWREVNPSPSCPTASEIMGKINKICHKGLIERGEVIQKTVIETISSIEHVINKRNIENIINIAKKHFPENQFISLAENTKGVYERSNAPKNRYKDRSFDITRNKVTSANLSKKSIDSLKTTLEEINLKKKLNRASAISRFIKWVAAPTAKWLFTIIGAIIGAVITAIIIYSLGIKG